MTINQKIKKLETIKDLIERLESLERVAKDDIQYYERQFEGPEERTDEGDYRVKSINDCQDRITAINYLKKELEKLA